MTEPLIQLKPCPFCGSTNVKLENDRAWWVSCFDCGASAGYDLGNSGACEAWNTRPIEAQLYEALRDLLMDCEDRGPTQASKNKAQAAIAAAEGAP